MTVGRGRRWIRWLQQIGLATICESRSTPSMGRRRAIYPEFTRFLVREGISSISLNPDALARGIEAIAAAEGAERVPATP